MISMRQVTSVFIALVVLFFSHSTAFAQGGDSGQVRFIEVPDPRGFIDAFGEGNVQEALRHEIEAGRRYFILVAARTGAYVQEIRSDDNVLTRRRKVEQAAKRIKSAAQSPVTSEKYKEVLLEIQRRVREDTGGNVRFTSTMLGVSHITVTLENPEASTTEPEPTPPPDVDEKPENEIAKIPVYESVLGRSILFGLIGIVLLLFSGAALWMWMDHRRRKLEGEKSTASSGRDGSEHTGDRTAARDENSDERRRRSATRNTPTTGDNSRPERRPRRRGTGRNAGLLLAAVFLGLSLRAAHAQTPSRLVAFDVSGSSYESSIADARTWTSQAVSNGKTVRVVAFGDSAWVVAESVNSQAAVDSILSEENITPQSLTRLANALRFIEEQARRLRSRGVAPHVRLASDFNSDDAGNEALKYMRFASDSTGLPTDTGQVRDSINVHKQRSGAWWWWGVGTGAGSAILLVGALAALLPLRRDKDDKRSLDDTAVQVIDDEGRRDRTWRDITQRGSLSLREDDVELAVREEKGDRILLLGLGGTEPLKEVTEDSRRAADGNRRRQRAQHRSRR